MINSCFVHDLLIRKCLFYVCNVYSFSLCLHNRCDKSKDKGLEVSQVLPDENYQIKLKKYFDIGNFWNEQSTFQ